MTADLQSGRHHAVLGGESLRGDLEAPHLLDLREIRVHPVDRRRDRLVEPLVLGQHGEIGGLAALFREAAQMGLGEVIDAQLAQRREPELQQSGAGCIAPVAFAPHEAGVYQRRQQPRHGADRQAAAARQLRQAVRPPIALQVSRRRAQVHAPRRQACARVGS